MRYMIEVKKMEKNNYELEEIETKKQNAQIREFAKKYFAYQITDPKISIKTKQELEKLGAYQPPYADEPEKRAIKITALLDSSEAEIKQIVCQAVRNYFAVDTSEEITSLLTKIKTYHTNLKV